MRPGCSKRAWSLISVTDFSLTYSVTIFLVLQFWHGLVSNTTKQQWKTYLKGEKNLQSPFNKSLVLFDFGGVGCSLFQIKWFIFWFFLRPFCDTVLLFFSRKHNLRFIKEELAIISKVSPKFALFPSLSNFLPCFSIRWLLYGKKSSAVCLSSVSYFQLSTFWFFLLETLPSYQIAYPVKISLWTFMWSALRGHQVSGSRYWTMRHYFLLFCECATKALNCSCASNYQMFVELPSSSDFNVLGGHVIPRGRLVSKPP